MKVSNFLVFLLIISIFSSCNSDDKQIDFTFIQLNDVYEIGSLGEYGGLDKVETLHKKLKAENENTFMFMAGDFLNPSLLSTIKVDGKRLKGKHMIEVMNAMNFDLVGFGNHEFDPKEAEFQERLNQSTFQWISTNAQYNKDKKVIPFYKEQNGEKIEIPRTITWNLKDADGTEIKIGFIAPVLDSNPKDYVDYGDFYEDSKNAFNNLKNETDVVFGLTHLEMNQDKLLAEMLQEIPLFMGGHEHANTYVKVGNVTIAKADANAKTAYIHRIKFNTKTKETSIESELVTIDNSIEPDVEVAKIISKWNVFLDEKLKNILPEPNKVIYTAKEALDGRDAPTRSVQTNLGDVITRAMSKAFNDEVDCAIVNGGSIRIDDKLEGEITGVDIFRVLPFGGGVQKIKLKGSLLEKTLNYGRLKAGTGAYLQRYKADYDKELSRWFIAGKPLKKNKVYTIAVSDYLMLGRDIPVLKADNKEVIKIFDRTEEDLHADIRKVVIEYLEGN
ncbi:MAG: bifunctional metallophosphatase/5'-nucleotidase [Chitinophagales bacterium]